jgi:hypothetical protein
MKSITKWFIIAGLLAGLAPIHAQAENHRLGAGANYWYAIDDIDVDDVDDDGFSYLVTYQYKPSLIGIQIDGELLPDRFGEDAYAAAGYLVVGGAIYGSVGVGILNVDGEWADDPFYALRLGLDFELLPGIHLDISGSYRFDSETKIGDALDDYDTDTVFLGAAARVAF